jgi:hypothetical protein
MRRFIGKQVIQRRFRKVCVEEDCKKEFYCNYECNSPEGRRYHEGQCFCPEHAQQEYGVHGERVNEDYRCATRFVLT